MVRPECTKSDPPAEADAAYTAGLMKEKPGRGAEEKPD